MLIPAYAWLIAAVVALALTWWGYRFHWSKNGYWKLSAALRFIASFLVLLLLFHPAWNRSYSEKSAPRWDVYIDFSQSAHSDSTAIKQWLDSLESAHPHVEFEKFVFAEQLLPFGSRHLLGGNLSRLDLPIEHMQLRKGQTQLSILLSDGIQNQGRLLSSFDADKTGPVWTVALGDSQLQKDIYVKDILANTEVFQGNTTEVEARVATKALQGQSLTLEWLLNGKVVKTERWTPETQKDHKSFGLTVSSDKQHQPWLNITLRAAKVPGEFNIRNNEKSAVIKVKDTRKIIDLVYGAPHPDLKSIQWALLDKEAYTLRVYSEDSEMKRDADVFIAHGLKRSQTIQHIKKTKTPVWWFVPTLGTLKEMAPDMVGSTFGKSLVGNQEVIPAMNEGFTSFELPSAAEVAKLWGVVEAPLGTFQLPIEHIQMFQVWGGAKTQVPLMWTQKVSQPEHVFLGTGIWKWRMNECRKNDKPVFFDAWVSRNVQWLSRASDSRKGWEHYTANSQGVKGEKCKIKWMYYDEAGEKRLQKGVNAFVLKGSQKELLPIWIENQEYVTPFVPDKAGIVQVVLEDGQGKRVSEAVLQVGEISLEAEQTQAQHEGLRELGLRTEGAYTSFVQRNSKAWSVLQDKGFDGFTLRKMEKIIPLEQFWPWVILLIVCLTGEWSLRKWLGKV